MSVFNGRSSRGKYIVIQLILLAVTIGLIALIWPLGLLPYDFMFISIFVTWFVAMSAVYLIYSVRRLHDVGQPGWWMLAHLVPFGGLALEIWLTIAPGQRKENGYGHEPDGLRDGGVGH